MNRFLYSLTLTLLGSAVIQIPEISAQEPLVSVQKNEAGERPQNTLHISEEELPIVLIEDNQAFEEETNSDQTIFFNDGEKNMPRHEVEVPALDVIPEQRDTVPVNPPVVPIINQAPLPNKTPAPTEITEPTKIEPNYELSAPAVEIQEQENLTEKEVSAQAPQNTKTVDTVPTQEGPVAKNVPVVNQENIPIQKTAPVIAEPSVASEPKIPLENARTSTNTEAVLVPAVSHPEEAKAVPLVRSQPPAQLPDPTVAEPQTPDKIQHGLIPIQTEEPAPMQLKPQAQQPSPQPISSAAPVQSQPQPKPAFSLDNKAPIPSKLFGDTGFAPTVLNKQIAISPEQRAKMLMKKKYDEMDFNQDGTVTEEEFVEYKTNEARKIAIEIFRHVDIDHDGIISEDEYEVLMRKMIDSYLKQPELQRSEPSVSGPRILRK